MKHSTNYMSTFKPTAQCQTTNPLIINILKSFIGCIFFFAAAQASAQTWQTVVDISRTSFNQSPTNSVYTVPAGGPYRYRITVKGGNGGGSNPSGNVTPTQGGRGGVFSSEYDLPTGWTLDCVAGSNGKSSYPADKYGAGGGGASGVYLYSPLVNGPLIVAGGGGGAGGGSTPIFITSFQYHGGGDALGYASPGGGNGGHAGFTNAHPSPNDWAGGGGGGVSGHGGDNNLGKGGKLYTAGGGMGGNSNLHPSFTSLSSPGGGGFVGGGGASGLYACAGGGGGGFTGGGGGGNSFNTSTPIGYEGIGGTSFNSTLGYNTSTFSLTNYSSVGGSVKVEILLRLSDFGTIIPNALPDDLVFEFNQLEALYRATNGANWTNKTNWLTGGDMSAWHGVTLTADGKSVLKIELPSNNLNNLSGTVTTTLPDLNLPDLQTLNLGNNALRGTIPNFNYLPTLETLSLNTNQFSGSVPLFNNCIALSRLNLAINNLTGSVPNFSNNFSGNNWLHIDLGLNQLTGSLPRLVLANLRFFSVYGNQLTGFPDYFYLPFASTDFTFNIENNNFSGRFPPVYTFFSQILTLQNLYMRNNKFNFGDLLGQNFLTSTGTVAYAPQQKIGISYTNGALEVNTGVPTGSTTQTFYWYKDNAVVAVNNNNWYRPTATGVYRVEVAHSTLTTGTGDKNLILISNNITVSTLQKSNGGRNFPTDLLPCLADDFNELEKIYDATGGANWTNKTNWFTSSNIASWHGVWAMSADGCNVADLVLNSNNLNGILPNLSFPSATRLSFADNLLRGSIPTITAPNLKILGFGSNQLSGNIPNFSFTLDEFYINNNRFIYGDMEGKTWLNTPVLHYKDQASIPTTLSNCVLTVNTGSTATDQTFIWFRKNADGSLTELTRGNSPQFTPSVAGTYLCHAYHFTLSRADIPSRNLVLVSQDFFIGNRLYVKPAASGNGSGDSWANAISGLQSALERAACMPSEIWVSSGTYRPSKDIYGNVYLPSHNTFRIPNGTLVYGSFAGTETNLSERTPSVMRANPSILHGDVSNNDIGSFSGAGSSLAYDLVNDSDNASHVVVFHQNTAPTRLDGFTVAGGRAKRNTPDINIFSANLPNSGGGIWNNATGTNVTIANCRIVHNMGDFGGGMLNNNASPTVAQCIFETNLANNHGGAMVNFANATPNVVNCVFSGNRAFIVGGGIANFSGSAMTLANSTMVLNNAQAGGGFYNDNSNANINNSIIWANGADGLNNYQSTPNVNNSTLQVAYSGGNSANNSINNPSFINLADPDGADNAWFTADDGLELGCGSPAFNAGRNDLAPATDILGKSRSQFSIVDMGAYEASRNIPPLTASINVTPNCGSSTLLASISPIVGGETYAWSGGTTPSVASNSITTSGNYTVTVTNNSGCLATATIAATVTAQRSRLYVNAANTNLTKDGLTWATAFNDLQSALSACKTSGAEIWVAAGTYKPSVDYTGNASPSDNRIKTFVIPANVLIYGGFVGTETALSQRPTPSVNASILSGDFSGNDAVTGNGADLLVSNFEENAYHVVVANNQTGTSRLDGFTIVGGNANLAGNYNNYGGGVLSLDGGVNFTLANCILSKNSGELGGGMANVGNASTQVVNCVFEKNYTSLHGAAATNYLSTPTFSNCVFTGNYAYAVGGAVYNLLTANATFKNSSFVGNAARLAAGGTIYNDGSFPTVSNTIIWANQPADAFGTFNSGTPTLSYSIVQNGDLTNNNLNFDPLFRNIADPDGTDNQWFTADDGLHLACGSPAFNSGTNTGAPATDVRGISRPQLTTVDRGAYESTTDLTLPIATISGATTGCGTVNLTANVTPPLGAGGYAWSGGSTPSVASNSFTSSGTYTVTVTNAESCSQTASATVTVIPLPIISFTNQIVTCAAATVTANGGNTYAWNGGTTPSAARNSFLTSGTYTVTVTNNSTGCFASQNITLTLPTDAARLYVNAANNNPTKDGFTWATAFTDLQAALETCSGVVSREIWVAKGTYKPSRIFEGTDNRKKTFLIPNGLKIYGGFVGTETNLSERTPSVIGANPTILSGDLNGDDVVTGVSSGLSISNNTENVYIVALAIGAGAATVLDGLIISGGNANQENLTTTFQGQVIYHNSGSGFYQIQSATTLNRVIFRFNSASFGAGLYNNASFSIISNCVFDRNFAGTGAAMLNLVSATPTIRNSIFYGNRALSQGGAISNLFGANPTITHSTFVKNAAPSNFGVITENSTTLNLNNSIFWDNQAQPLGIVGQGNYNVLFCIIDQQSHTGFRNNIASNPQFKNSNDPDGADNQWFTADDGLQLGCVSGAFNTGNNTGAPATDILGNARPQFTTTDRGAYESTVDLTNPIQSVQITGANIGCAQVSLTASVTPSATYTYAWSGGNTPSVSSNTFTASGTYSVTVTNENGCTATASQYATVIQPVTPTVSIVVSPSNTVTAGTNVTFTATPINGGTTPQYQWYVNNNAVGTNSATFSSSNFENGHMVRCVLTSNLTCLTTTTANSNAITMSVLDCSSVTRLHVKPTASGIGDGSNWANATADLQGAINNVCGVTEVWVAAGTYKPTQDLLGNSNPTDPRDKAFLLKNGVKIYGGFVGTEGSLSERPTAIGGSILSGDFTGNDNGFTNNAENAYHVVASVSDDNTTVLDGFTIKGGNANGTGTVNVESKAISRGSAGGLYVSASSPMVTNCVFTQNSGSFAGAMLHEGASSPQFSKAAFHNNQGGFGGVAFNGSGSSPRFTNVVFTNNAASVLGGAFYHQASAPTFTNCTFNGNTHYNEQSLLTMTNCIVWNGGVTNPNGALAITYSVILGIGGTGNTAANPQFTNETDPDGADNQWFTADDGLRIACNSPARDAGTNTSTPTTDALGRATFNSLKDMGAYETQDNNGCPIYVGTSACQSVTINNVSGNRAYNFFINNQLIATLNPNGQNLGNVTVEIGDPLGVTTAGGIKYLGRNINVTSTIVPAQNYTLCLYYKDSELTEFNSATSTTTTLSNLDMAWKSGGTGCDWLNYFGINSGTIIKAAITPVDYGVNSDGFYLQFNLNHFTLFAPTGSSTPLPVELLNFYGNTEGDKNFLHWQTGVENGTSHFDIERSFEGINFIKIGAAKAHASNSVYDFVDDKPKFGLNYYRLKINDLDGKINFSKIISLDNKNTEGGKIKVYPNPVDTYLNIELAEPTEPTEPTEEVVIINGIGQIILKQKVSGQSQCVLDLHLLPSGVYVLKTKGDIKGIKFVKL